MTSPNRPSPTSVRPSNPPNPQNALVNSNRSPTPSRPPNTIRTSLVHNQNNNQSNQNSQNSNVPPLPCPQPPRPIAPNLVVRPPRPPAGRFPVRNMSQTASQPQLTLKAEFIITPSSLVGRKKINIMRLKIAAPINNKPTSEVALTAIAPYAGARQNKKNLFKKKTTQVFLADPKTRELKAEEHIPWVLEDFGGENVFVGSYIGGDTAKYCVFLKQMARAKKMESDRWMMRKFGKTTEAEDIATEEGGIYDPKSSIKTVENEEDLFGSDEEHRPSREGFDEEMDYDEIFEDDEEDLPDDANPLIDDETKEVGKLKAKVKHPFELNNQSSDEEEKLTSEGKQMKKLIRTHDDNDAYESDRESNPYVTESDATDSEDTSSISKQSSTTGPSSNKASPVMKTEKISEKGKSTSKSKVIKAAPPKNKAPANVKPKVIVEKPKPKSKQKQVAPKTVPSNKVKIPEKRALSSDSTLSEIENSSSSKKRSRSSNVQKPTPVTTPTPARSANTSPSSPTSPEDGGPSKKQKISKASSIARQPGSSSAPSGSNLITEREIKDLILTKSVKVNDLIRTFKNRIKEDSRNRDRLLSITKEIA
ncbi:21119_t:CDS:2, partial [Dentiscutata erythropus]